MSRRSKASGLARAGDPPWWTELVGALEGLSAGLAGDASARDARELWSELQLFLVRLVELELQKSPSAPFPQAGTALGELVRHVSPLPEWYVCDAAQRSLSCLQREPAKSTRVGDLPGWARRFVRSISSEPQAVSYRLGELRERLLTVALHRLTSSAVQLSANGCWIEVAQIAGWEPETRAKRLQRECRLPKTIVARLGPPLAHAGDEEELLRALLPLVSRQQLSPAWVLQPALARRSSGSHYTPWLLCQQLSEQALAPLLSRCSDVPEVLALRICDPAMGTGQFLLAAAKHILQRIQELSRPPSSVPKEGSRSTSVDISPVLHGVDADPVAVTLARLGLAHYTGRPPGDFGHALAFGNAVTGPTSATVEATLERSSRKEPTLATSPGTAPPLDWERTFPEVFAIHRGGFDAVLGNPPWVAYVGRAAQPLEPGVAEYFRQSNPAFARYRTLHGVFVYRCASLLRAGGRLGLILPTSVADLLGYEPTRAAHDSLCLVDPLLPDWGDGAFDQVFQPSMALLSTRRSAVVHVATQAPSWPLVSPIRDEAESQLLQRLSAGPRISREAFGERGYQTSKTDEAYVYDQPGSNRIALRVGAEVGEFSRLQPQAFVEPKQLSGRLRPVEHWRTVRVLIRQTARYPIACESDGLAFRNSILAGFDTPECSAEALVAFLNSTLARWYHFQSHRDARQGMPQLKIGHLRALPALPDGKIQSKLSQLARTLSEKNAGVSDADRRALDHIVGLAFDLSQQERRILEAFGREQPIPTARKPRAPAISAP